MLSSPSPGTVSQVKPGLIITVGITLAPRVNERNSRFRGWRDALYDLVTWSSPAHAKI
jgi:hypothetical protein